MWWCRVKAHFQICFGICSDGVNTHFGTEYSKECWCTKNPELTTNGIEVDSTECDMACASASDSELCGGYDRITAYKVRQPTTDGSLRTDQLSCTSSIWWSAAR